MRRVSSHHVAFRGVPEETPKRHDRSDAGEVEEDDRG